MPPSPRARRALALALALAVVAGGVLPAAAQPRGEPVKIGWISELSGTWAFFGATCFDTAKIAEEEINARGGVLGRPIAVLPQDNRTDPAQAVAAARVLDSQDKVLTLSGPTSSDTALAVYGYAEGVVYVDGVRERRGNEEAAA